MLHETWRSIPGYEGLYEVSDFGQVRSTRREGTPGGILTPFVRAGYLGVYLYRGNSRRNFHVHRLVLLAHVGPPPTPKHQAAHNNGNREENLLTNLRWATVAENTTDRARHGAWRRAIDGRLALSPEDAEFVRANHRKIKQADLAEMFGVHRSTIQRIHSGERNAALALTSIDRGIG